MGKFGLVLAVVTMLAYSTAALAGGMCSGVHTAETTPPVVVMTTPQEPLPPINNEG